MSNNSLLDDDSEDGVVADAVSGGPVAELLEALLDMAAAEGTDRLATRLVLGL